MRIMDETPEERLAQDISALNDSVTTLSSLMEEAQSDIRDSRIRANYEHLELMLVKLGSSLNSGQKSTFSNSASTAKAFLNS